MPIKTFNFQRAYEMASLVEACGKSPGSFIELDWENHKVSQCLAKYSKISLLHYFIYAMIAVEQRRDYRKNWDFYDAEGIAEIEQCFETYNISFVPFLTFAPFSSSLETEFHDVFYKWFRFQEEIFEELWEKITNEVFHLLFANRTFLKEFNLSLADYLEEGNVTVPSEYLDEKGVLKRQSYVPSWLKKAVYCRDHGRCVLCQKDLTGLLSTDRQVHYDHIVPLKLWGVNDPCNMQLLCDACNLRKSGASVETAAKYPAWWDY